ncbi:general stress protein [Actinomadura kijaniata]|uniref:general stress protein n=1 Tax=Actinomadura kijaniata TaxID=46161 RepID=UPI000AF0AA07|nr:general stress protein [Actinomadura kijaniata]
MPPATLNTLKPPTGLPALGQRVVVGSYSTYDQAQSAMDFLADQDFPVARTAIVGSDLRMVETILGKLTWPHACVLTWRP